MSPTHIAIQALGELGVRAGAAERPLPRSRKTRALLGYLALTGRAHRREQLCDLFWDVTDDPRAALRWSLSKLRKVLELPGAPCLVATRTHVHVQLPAGALDVDTLRLASRRGFESLATEELEALAAACRGELLEGLWLSDFDAFEAWLEAERAEARALHGRLSRTLVARLADEPERALPHARAWLARSGAEDAGHCVARLSAELERRASQMPEPGRRAPGAPEHVAVSLAPPAAASRASARAAGHAGLPSAPLPELGLALVGRDREISRLCVIADGARAQRGGRIVLVLGEPGMGKTRLLAELRQRLHPLEPSVLDAAFYEAERHRPLAPFLDATRGALPSPLTSGDAATDREHLFESLAALIRRGADESGLCLLLLDDAHLADPSSCELLHYVVRTAARVPLLTVLACRPAELDDNAELMRTLVALRRRHPVEEISLSPLAPEAVAALIRAEAPALPCESLVRESAGNPLVALELCRAARSEGTVPRSLTDLVLARIAGLPEAVGKLVRWASVIERGPLAVLDAACGEAGFVDALETATRYALVRFEPRGEAFAMSHGLIQRVVYEAISPVRRAAMHRRVAELLAESAGADYGSLIAHHATRADRPDLAARALLDGAQRCARVGAVQEAAELADRALSVLPALDPSLGLDIELSALLVLVQVRRAEQPAAIVTRLTELGLSALDRGRSDAGHQAFHAASALRWEAGAGYEGYGLARQAWQAAHTGDDAERARASSYMALCLAMLEKQLPDAQALVFEAEALARTRLGAPEPPELVMARAQLHGHAGRLSDARRDALDARALARACHNGLLEATAAQMSMQLEYAAGQPLAARAAAEALAELSTRIREGGEAALATAGLALSQASLDEARPALALALERLRQLDDKRRLAWVANRWAGREREQGDASAAGPLATRALAAARAVEAHSEAAIATCELMAAAARAADDVAYADAEASLAELESTGTLSHEAVRWIERTTKTPGPAGP